MIHLYHVQKQQKTNLGDRSWDGGCYPMERRGPGDQEGHRHGFCMCQYYSISWFGWWSLTTLNAFMHFPADNVYRTFSFSPCSHFLLFPVYIRFQYLWLLNIMIIDNIFCLTMGLGTTISQECLFWGHVYIFFSLMGFDGTSNRGTQWCHKMCCFVIHSQTAL